jgi:hypothetical protein
LLLLGIIFSVPFSIVEKISSFIEAFKTNRMATGIISKEEAGAMRLLPFGKKHAVRILIEQLKPGQMLKVERGDFSWRGKNPNFFCRQVSKSTKAKFQVMKMPGNTGWVVERLE